MSPTEDDEVDHATLVSRMNLKQRRLEVFPPFGIWIEFPLLGHSIQGRDEDLQLS